MLAGYYLRDQCEVWYKTESNDLGIKQYHVGATVDTDIFTIAADKIPLIGQWIQLIYLLVRAAILLLVRTIR